MASPPRSSEGECKFSGSLTKRSSKWLNKRTPILSSHPWHSQIQKRKASKLGLFRYRFVLPSVYCRSTCESLPPGIQALPPDKNIQDLALSTADRNHIRYVLAQDPDSDRFAAAEKSYVFQWPRYSAVSHASAPGTIEPGTSSRGTNLVQCLRHGCCVDGKPAGNHLVGD
jgi:hypothetical protein